MNLLPLAYRENVQRYRRWQDQHAMITGRLLLLYGLELLGVGGDLALLKYTKYGKPYMKDINFNISHSGEWVLCAISQETAGSLGIDIEENREIDPSEFKHVWTHSEERDIQERGLNTFYEYWTRKEAAIKADGRGISAPLTKIDVRGPEVTIDNQCYWLYKIDVPKGYTAHLATNDSRMKIRKLVVDVRKLGFILTSSEYPAMDYEEG